jgi:hypothetical protein
MRMLISRALLASVTRRNGKDYHVVHFRLILILGIRSTFVLLFPYQFSSNPFNLRTIRLVSTATFAGSVCCYTLRD